MVKAKTGRGSSFRGISDYVFGAGKTPEIVGGNMTGTDPRSLAAEFRVFREMRPECKRPVWHCALACPPGERPTPEQWRKIAAAMVKKMGLEGHAFIVVRHSDTDIDHCHLIVSRIGPNGQLWHGANDVHRAIKATQQIEREFGLTLTPGFVDDDDTAPEQRAKHDVGTKGVTRGEIEKAQRTGEAPARMKLQDLISAAVDYGRVSVLAFIDQLEAAGVTVLPNVARTGKLNGFSFEIDGVPFKGSQLGKSFALKALIERGMDYEQGADAPGLIARADRIRSRISEIGRGVPAPAGAEPGPSSDGHVDADAGVSRQLGGDGADPGNGDEAGRGGAIEGREGDPEPVEGGSDVAGPGGAVPDRIDSIGDGRRSDDLDTVFDRIADLAAPANPGPLGRVAEPARPLTKAQETKARAWARQHEALGAPAYRLTLMSRRDHLSTFVVGNGRGADGTERFYTPDEVRDLIPYLSRQNLTGYDVYITPIDDDYFYLLMDDTDLARIEDMRSQGYSPALVQESSAGNLQAILRIPRTNAPQERKAANALMVKLNQKWGDPKISGVIHAFRMAGFSNKKPGRDDAFTRIIEAAGVVCGRAADMLAGGVAKLQALIAKPSPALVPAPESRADIRFTAIRRREAGLATSKGWTINEDTLDYRTAVEMINEDFDADDIAGAMQRLSPQIGERHPKILSYLKKTLTAAGRAQPRPNANEGSDKDGPSGPSF